MLLHGSPGQTNTVHVTVVRIFLSYLCWNLVHTSRGREAGLNSIRNRVEEGAAATVTVIAGAGVALIAEEMHAQLL